MAPLEEVNGMSKTWSGGVGVFDLYLVRRRHQAPSTAPENSSPQTSQEKEPQKDYG